MARVTTRTPMTYDETHKRLYAKFDNTIKEFYNTTKQQYT